MRPAHTGSRRSPSTRRCTCRRPPTCAGTSPPSAMTLLPLDADPDDGGMARRAYRRARVDRASEEAVEAAVEVESTTATPASPALGNAALARLGGDPVAAAAS